MQLQWRALAWSDLVSHVNYLSEQSSDAGQRFIDAVDMTCTLIRNSPEIGEAFLLQPEQIHVRVWPIRGYRNYLIAYRVTEDAIEIVRLRHGASNWRYAPE